MTVFGMQFLDFFDFLTNSVMMPIAAIAICLLVSRVIGVQKIEEEVTLGGKPFRRKKIFNFMIQYLCPIFAAIILISSVANALGWIANVKTKKRRRCFSKEAFSLFVCPKGFLML